ncbi:MAG: hypothetical protein M3Q07_11005 [Pseudobdellovibrionaceae bacterium]|nr:hypothetical protein [Pseudobdellovibrionaceae bacterium]
MMSNTSIVRRAMRFWLASSLFAGFTATATEGETSHDTIEDELDPSKLDYDGMYYALYRNKDEGTGEYCSHKGSLLIRMDINQDGFEDTFCKDVNGFEEITSGMRLFYGYPAVKSRVSTVCLHPAVTFYVLPKSHVIICNSNERQDGNTYMDFHRYLKPLF